jgi:hypothetical protein
MTVDAERTHPGGIPPVLDETQYAILDLFATAHSDRDIAQLLSLERTDVHARRIEAMGKPAARGRRSWCPETSARVSHSIEPGNAHRRA